MCLLLSWLDGLFKLIKLEQIYIQAIKRILDVPVTSPTNCVLLETGYKPLKYFIDKRKLMYYFKSQNYDDNNLAKKMSLNNNNYFRIEIETLKIEYDITNFDNFTKNTLKKYINSQQEKIWHDYI